MTTSGYYVQEFWSVNDELVGAGQMVDESVMILNLIRGLELEYYAFVSCLNAHIYGMSFQNVISKVQGEGEMISPRNKTIQ